MSQVGLGGGVLWHTRCQVAVLQLWAHGPGCHAYLIRIFWRDVATCLNYKSIQAFVSRGGDGEEALPSPELQRLSTSIQRSGYVDVISLQILVTDQATQGFRGIHGSRTHEGISSGQHNLCPALPELEVPVSGHCSNFTSLPGCLPNWKLKKPRIRQYSMRGGIVQQDYIGSRNAIFSQSHIILNIQVLVRLDIEIIVFSRLVFELLYLSIQLNHIGWCPAFFSIMALAATSMAIPLSRLRLRRRFRFVRRPPGHIHLWFWCWPFGVAPRWSLWRLGHVCFGHVRCGCSMELPRHLGSGVHLPDRSAFHIFE